MENGRNTSGQFTKGHSGFKPKGAISKKKHSQTARRDQIIELIWQHLAESIPDLSPKLRMKLVVELLKLSTPKLKRIPYVPAQAVTHPGKVTFELKHQE